MLLPVHINDSEKPKHVKIKWLHTFPTDSENHAESCSFIVFNQACRDADRLQLIPELQFQTRLHATRFMTRPILSGSCSHTEYIRKGINSSTDFLF